MKHWHIIKELMQATGVFVSAAAFTLLAAHVYQRIGFSAVFVAAVLLSVCSITIIVAFFWDWAADLLRWSGRSRTAEAVLKDSLTRWKKLVGENGPGAAVKSAHLADFYLELGRKGEAEQLYKQIADRWKPSLVALVSPVCRSLERFARLLESSQRQQEARELRRKLRGSGVCRVLLGLCLAGLTLFAVTYLVLTQLLESAIANFPPTESPKLRREHLEDLARIERSVTGPRGAAAIYYAYGMRQFADQTDLEEADWALTNAVDALRSDPQANKIMLARCLNRLASLIFSAGESKQAEALYQESISLDTGAGGDADAARGEALFGMAKICQARRDMRQAEQYFESALEAARRVYGPDSGDAIDASLGLADARRSNGDNPKSEALLNDAVDRAEKLFHRKAQYGNPAKDDRDRLVTALILKSQVLRTSGRTKEADALEKQVDEIQWSRRPHLKLNENIQNQIVQTVQDATDWLLSIKYGTRQGEEGRSKLTQNLTAEARSHLSRLPWYSPEKDVTLPILKERAPDAVKAQFGQISVRSPDSTGMLTVEVRGRSNLHIANQYVNGEPFAFAYRIRPPAPGSRRIPIEDVEELNPLSTLD